MLDEFTISCPYCGENIPVLVDPTPGDQIYIEDCSICCQPMRVTVLVEPDGTVSGVSVDRED